MTQYAKLPMSRIVLPAVCTLIIMALFVLPAKANPQASATAKVPNSWCTAQETNVFTCRAGKKTVSVCASSDASANTGALHYRFGQLTGGLPPEMTLPDKATPPRLSATGETATYAGGGGSWLRFKKGAHAYVVYAGIGRWGPKGEPRALQGVAVEHKGKLIANLPCPTTQEDELGRDWFEEMGIQLDAQDFWFPNNEK
jgi:hypothetical protein